MKCIHTLFPSGFIVVWKSREEIVISVNALLGNKSQSTWENPALRADDSTQRKVCPHHVACLFLGSTRENISDSAAATPRDDSSSHIRGLFDLEGGGITNCHKADVSSSALINLSIPPSRSSASTHFFLIPANQRRGGSPVGHLSTSRKKRRESKKNIIKKNSK